MTRRLRYLILALGLGLNAPAWAQPVSQPAVLVADNVFVQGQDRLVARGTVEALSGEYHLSASQITYDKASDQLQIQGPIRITDAQGTVLLADQATMDPALRNGLVQGARLVLDQQLQIAAHQARRVNGRYSELSKTAVTSCRVCNRDETPLWQIRAKRVVHDQLERQLYFDQAQLRIKDVPVFYLPRLRLPDPSLKRARGVLLPTVRRTSRLGWGVRVPYFIPLGDHKDITLTPYLSEKSRTVELRYRQAFWNGDLTVQGALSSDELDNQKLRGYAFAQGKFKLARDYQLSFDLRAAGDISYLNDYDITSRDRLRSDITLQQLRRDKQVNLSLIHYQSLRADESYSTQPALIGTVDYEKRYFPQIGGELRLAAQGYAFVRWSDRMTDGPDADTLVDGRDAGWLSAQASWQDRWTLPVGLRAGASGHIWLDHYETRQDPAFDDRSTTATFGGTLDLRYPLQRRGQNGARSLIEPLVQLGWVSGKRAQNPNEASTRVEFDEGNLLSLSHFPAADRRERGIAIASGLRMTHHTSNGWKGALSLGQIWRDSAETEFTPSSGLDGLSSDLLVAGQIAYADKLHFSARGLLDENFKIGKLEARSEWRSDQLDLSLSYLRLGKDPLEDRSIRLSEWSFDGSYRLNDHWETSVGARYDLGDDRLDRASLGLQYQNECALVGLKATRTYASARNLEPSTEFNLSVALKGFGVTGSAKEYKSTCAK